MTQVTFRSPGEMNLLGYFLRSLLDRNLAADRTGKAIKKMKGTILVGASGMKVTLDFNGPNPEIVLGEDRQVDARVEGSLGALLAVALGGSKVWPVLTGRLSIGGKLWRLLPLLRLLRAKGAK